MKKLGLGISLALLALVFLPATQAMAQNGVECPLGASQEGEPCGTDTNGGCNSSPPIFTDINCGDVVCGTFWADGGTRDTDWYQLVLDKTTTVTQTATAEISIVIGIIKTDPPGSGDCDDLLGANPFATGDPLEQISVEDTLGPGTYWLFVAPLLYDGHPCASGPHDYVMSVSCSGGPHAIPTLSEWGIVILSLLLAGSAIWVIRRKIRAV